VMLPTGAAGGPQAGVVVQVGRTHLQVLLSSDVTQSLPPSQLRGKVGHRSGQQVAMDQNQQQVGVRDVVRIIEGSHKGEDGTVRHVFKGVLFLHSHRRTDRGGFFAVRARGTVVAGNKMASGAGGVLMGMVADASRGDALGGLAMGFAGGGGRGRGRGRGGGRGSGLAGQTVRITSGIYRRRMGVVKGESGDFLHIELHSGQKKVRAKRSQVQVIGDRNGRTGADALAGGFGAGMGMGMGMGGFTAAGMPGMPGAAGGFGGATPAIGGATPVIGGATPRVGGATPAYGGATPAYGGATPAYGGATPAYGGATPMAGGATPKYGGATPRTGAAAEESEAWRPTAFSGATGGLGAEGEAGDAADLRAAAATMGTVPSSLSAGASAPSERWRRWCVERAVVQLVADPTQVAYVVAPPPPGLTGEAARARLRWIEGASSGQDEDVAMHRLEPKPVSESDTVRCLDDNKKGQIFGIENGEAVVQLEDNDFSNKQMRDLVVLYEGGS